MLLLFSGTNCHPCKAMKQTLRELKCTYELYDVDSDVGGKKALEYCVRSLPTLIKVEDGKAIQTLVGSVNRSTLKSFLSSL